MDTEGLASQDGLQTRTTVAWLILALLLNGAAYGAPQPIPMPSPAGQSQELETPQAPLEAADAAQQPRTDQAAEAQPESRQAGDDRLPDSPGAVLAQVAQAQAQQVPTQPAPTQESSEQSSSPATTAQQTSPPATLQPTQQQPESRPQEPLGTAAAESIPTMGVAASRPAGAALAPAKQRRVRSLLIKMGAVVGVGVAVGATMALSEGSPSRPSGAH